MLVSPAPAAGSCVVARQLCLLDGPPVAEGEVVLGAGQQQHEDQAADQRHRVQEDQAHLDTRKL